MLTDIIQVRLYNSFSMKMCFNIVRQNTEAIICCTGTEPTHPKYPRTARDYARDTDPQREDGYPWRHSLLNSRTLVMAFLRYSSIYCITTKEISIPERSVFSSICISTATISSFGAIVQIVNWYKKLQFSESRRILGPSPGVLFSLALADLFTCVGK